MTPKQEIALAYAKQFANYQGGDKASVEFISEKYVEGMDALNKKYPSNKETGAQFF